MHELGPDGRLLVRNYREYVGDKVRTLCRGAIELRDKWQDSTSRGEIIERLAERGIDFEHLARATRQPETDAFDLLLHVAFNAPLRTRRERAERVRTSDRDFFQRFGPDARGILDELLMKYADHGFAEFRLPDVLKLPPISHHGNPVEIASLFGGIVTWGRIWKVNLTQDRLSPLS